MRRQRRVAAAIAATLIVAALSACGAAKMGSISVAVTEAPGATIKLGVLTSLTGVASSGDTTVQQGVEARLGLQNAEGGVDGHKLSYVMADDQSTGPGAVTATQKLIQQDRVYGILDDSAFFSAAAETTTRFGTPVAGVSFDAGPEWFDNETNIFDAYGYGDYTALSTTWGKFYKSQGATKAGTVTYDDNPSSTLAGLESVRSAEMAGLKAGYVNTQVPFGSTNVGPVIQALKASGTNALYLPIEPNTAFAIAVGLEQAGVRLKAVVLATGYGGDLLQSKATVAAANGLDFATVAAPSEANTAGTRTFTSALATYAHVTTVPTFGEYIGWLTADLFIRGLELAGPNANSATFISKLRHSTWNGAGIESPINYARIQTVAGGQTQGDCIYITQLHGTDFVPLHGATPACGSTVPGVTIHQ